MLVVTGGISCGKSTFLGVAEASGYRCLDADDWFHDKYKHSEAYQRITRLCFGENCGNLGNSAFVHKHWATFEQRVLCDFVAYVNDQDNLDIVVLPEYFKYKEYLKAALPKHRVLTIEREDNLQHALARDVDRLKKLTKRIHHNQSSRQERIIVSDYVLYWEIDYSGFREDCKSWLQQYSLEVLTRHTSDMSMSSMPPNS